MRNANVATSARNVRICTRRYGIVHHPRTPRGFGLWHFESMCGGYTFSHTGTYGEAAAAARRWAAELSLANIQVGS